MLYASKIRFTFENCESVVLDCKYIGRCSIDTVQHRVSRLACNAIAKMQTGDDINIVISADIDEETKNRLLLLRDITCISLIDQDGNEDDFWVPWGANEDQNDYESHFINQRGDIFLSISAKNEFNRDFYSEFLVLDDNYWKGIVG